MISVEGNFCEWSVFLHVYGIFLVYIISQEHMEREREEEEIRARYSRSQSEENAAVSSVNQTCPKPFPYIQYVSCDLHAVI